MDRNAAEFQESIFLFPLLTIIVSSKVASNKGMKIGPAIIAAMTPA